ncbi:hypothetical protein CRYUN_Cryun01aG0032000 [Craigia yunnanensis]
MSLVEEESEEQSGSGSFTSVQHPDVIPDEIAEILDHQIRQQLVSPLNVQLEPDNYEVHFRKTSVTRCVLPRSRVILFSNHAQFLHLVIKDYDRAEECFKRAIQVEPQDAEALELYADFLWQGGMTIGRRKKDTCKQLQLTLKTLSMYPSMPIAFGTLVVKEPVFLSTLLMTAIIKFCNLGELRLS